MTPSSVKVLMLVEAGAIAFLSFWIHSEYVHNSYFRDIFNSMVVQDLGTYAVLSGLGLGLTGSIATFVLLRSLHRAKLRLETPTPSRLRGSVEKARLSIPTENHLSIPEIAVVNPLESLDQHGQVGVGDEKK